MCLGYRQEAAYKRDVESLLAECAILREDLLANSLRASTLQPAFYVAIDRVQRCVTVCIRGTQSLSDAITDLALTTRPFQDGHAHRGMLLAAQYVKSRVHNIILSALEEYPNYGLVFCGHSLGAGVAALLCMTYVDEYKWLNRCKAVCIACPPVVDRELSLKYAANIDTIVLGFDLVARMSISALHRLRLELDHINWEELWNRDWQETHVVKVFNSISTSAQRLWSAARELTFSASTTTTTTTTTMEESQEETEQEVARAAHLEPLEELPPHPELHPLFLPGTTFHLVRGGLRGTRFFLLQRETPELENTGAPLRRLELVRFAMLDHLNLKYGVALADAIKYAQYGSELLGGFMPTESTLATELLPQRPVPAEPEIEPVD
ncbi:MAG: hypothetical protein MHM6MM_002213 [Cercozoa sp. M6MM]